METCHWFQNNSLVDYAGESRNLSKDELLNIFLGPGLEHICWNKPSFTLDMFSFEGTDTVLEAPHAIFDAGDVGNGNEVKFWLKFCCFLVFSNCSVLALVTLLVSLLLEL